MIEFLKKQLFLCGLPHLCSQMSRLKRYKKVQQKHGIIDVPTFNTYSFENPLPPYSAIPLGMIIWKQQNVHGSDDFGISISIENDSKSLPISNCKIKEEIKPTEMCRHNERLNTSNDINIFDDAEKKTSKLEDNKAFKNTNLALHSMIPTDLASNAYKTDYDVFKNTSFCCDNYPQFKWK